MPARDRLEVAAVAAVAVACVAFIVSFVLGIGTAGRSQATSAPESVVHTAPERHAGRVEVLNASGRAGLARSATEQLRDGGFDVVFFGNASGFDGDSSIVIDRTGDDAVAQAAARRLGIPRVATRRDTTLLLDATVVLGRDWTRGEPQHTPEDERGWRARIGRWFRPTP